MIAVFVSLFIVSMVLATQFILSKTSDLGDSSVKALEAGFESLNSSIEISASFFLLAVLFVLFDVELVLLFPALLLFLELIVEKILFLMVGVIFTLMVDWWWCGLKWSF